MKLFSWNVNGIRAVIRKGEFEKFINTFDPDILCLQETKAEQGQAEIDLPQYKEYWNSSRTKKGYSGTAIFTKLEPLSVVNDIPEQFVQAGGLNEDDYGHSNDEGRVITAEFADYYVVTAYTPNAKDNLSRIPLREQWDKALTLYCADLQKNKPVIYCGDMNVAHTEEDLANPKPNVGKKGFTAEERTGFDNWLSAGFVDTFRIFTQGNGHYTWWSHFAKSRERNVGWRIDYFLVSEALKQKVKSAEIHANQLGSDHCPISIEIVD
ncbi:MAG: exodeoxyribonuclease III [Candidatus Nomurabacteria bacterium]|nr:exodeoxyribonuclease III [Candidatus Saccharibacteria bacterium]USN95570.1 MAG: exodeoxyribonuclease III [Candidatus Nomurabacteria bacterium]